VLTVTVSFGDTERSGGNISGGWISEQLHARQRAGEPACAQVSVVGDGVNVALAAGDCPSGRPSSRRPTLAKRRCSSCGADAT
jgi:hypothetical protein